LTRVQHRHGADPQGQDTAAGAAARQELDQIGRLVAAVEGEADPAAAEAGARRQGYRHGEVHGDRGIGRVAAIGQDVAADQRRARLVGGSSSPNPQAASTSAQIGRTASPARDIPWDIR
jgi:hypothetical protein